MRIIIKIAKKILAIIKIIKSINKYIDFKKIWDDFNKKHEVENNKRMGGSRNRRSLKKK